GTRAAAGRHGRADRPSGRRYRGPRGTRAPAAVRRRQPAGAAGDRREPVRGRARRPAPAARPAAAERRRGGGLPRPGAPAPGRRAGAAAGRRVRGRYLVGADPGRGATAGPARAGGERARGDRPGDDRAGGLPPGAADRARRRAAAAGAAAGAGQPGRALAAAVRAERDAGGDPPLLGRIAALRGQIQLRAGLISEAVGTLTAGAELVADTDPRAALEMLFGATEAAGYAGDMPVVRD